MAFGSTLAMETGKRPRRVVPPRGANYTEGRRFARMTPRLCEVAKLVAEGMRNKEIGERLRVGESTVKVYVSEIFTLTGTKSRVALANWCERQFGNRPVASEEVRMGAFE
jgi:DNA-binding NarL/FixJ family response regulator